MSARYEIIFSFICMHICDIYRLSAHCIFRLYLPAAHVRKELSKMPLEAAGSAVSSSVRQALTTKTIIRRQTVSFEQQCTTFSQFFLDSHCIARRNCTLY